ncbi:hypothetical protein GQ54DRAFT_246889, partial [Martensiomyces pterosporus]
APIRAFTTQGTAEGSPSDQQQRRGKQTRTKSHAVRGSTASDISPTPTDIVRLSDLPPGTTADDVYRMVIPGRNYMPRINSLQFEHDLHLRPLNSCRIKFFKAGFAQDYVTRANNMPFAGSTVRADFVTREAAPNPTVQKYIGHALGRLVYLYGYPAYVNQHQVRDFYRDYEIVDTVIPGIQPAPASGATFLSRRGAFILQFSTPSEARRFVRDVYMTEY